MVSSFRCQRHVGIALLPWEPVPSVLATSCVGCHRHQLASSIFAGAHASGSADLALQQLRSFSLRLIATRRRGSRGIGILRPK